MKTEVIAWMVLRIVFSWMYLYPIIGLLKDRTGLVETTRLLFKWKPAFFAGVSIIVMIIGALSILLGVYAQLGGLLLFIFTIGGTVVHYRLAKFAEVDLSNPDKMKLAKLAVVGHVTSAQKNFVLAAVAIFFFLLGSGPLSFTANLWRF